MLLDSINIRNGLVTRARLAFTRFSLIGGVFLLLSGGWGCASGQHTLSVWKSTAAFENVNRFRAGEPGAGDQWFARVLRSERMPKSAVFALSDRFDFVLLTRPDQWSQVVRASNLDARDARPNFDAGIVVGLVARVGEMRFDRWPILVEAVQQRGHIAFLHARFNEGFYRPLSVPPYMHLVYVRGVTTFLGVKINQLLYGFNVEIDDLHAVGIR